MVAHYTIRWLFSKQSLWERKPVFWSLTQLQPGHLAVHTHCHLSGPLAIGRLSALLGLPACSSPGHLASARFLELPASVRTSPHYSSPSLLSGSGLTFPAWASPYSTSCQMP